MPCYPRTNQEHCMKKSADVTSSLVHKTFFKVVATEQIMK